MRIRRGAFPVGRLSKLEAALTEPPWQEVRQDIEVKLLPQPEGELYVFAQSRSRIDKERAMRWRKLASFCSDWPNCSR